jgi:ABC transport system ATP-binding/permease protein
VSAPAAPAVVSEGLLSRLLQLRQASVLTSRYVDLKLGDLGGLALMLLQAPLIGWLIGLAYEGRNESPMIDFILALVAVWFGCFNGCREVVKERLIFLRERRAGVSVRAYIVSKVLVLALIAALQCLVLLLLVAHAVRMKGSMPLMYVGLLTTALTATALGLLLSSAVKSQNSLIALVPIVLIPQLIFSRVTLETTKPVVDRIENGMVAAWGYEVLNQLRKTDPKWLDLLKAELVLVGMGVGFLLLAALCLKAQDE